MDSTQIEDFKWMSAMSSHQVGRNINYHKLRTSQMLMVNKGHLLLLKLKSCTKVAQWGTPYLTRVISKSWRKSRLFWDEWHIWKCVNDHNTIPDRTSTTANIIYQFRARSYTWLIYAAKMWLCIVYAKRWKITNWVTWVYDDTEVVLWSTDVFTR